MRKGNLVALAGTMAGVAAGAVVERVAVRKRRAEDPEADQQLGLRRGTRSRSITRRDGAELFIEEAGASSRRGAIFIHGSALRTDAWFYQLAGIGNHRLVFYDLRGHGMSPAPREPRYDIPSLAGDLEVVMDECKLDEVILVGHSIGGMIAMTLCLEHPELMGSRIKGLGLLNTTYGPAVETLIGGAALARVERMTRRPFDMLGAYSSRIDRWCKVVKPSDALFWGVAFAAFAPGASAKHIDFAYDMVGDTPIDLVFELVKSYRAFDVRGRLDEINVPTLVISGVHDRLTLPSASEYLAEHLPKAELHILEECGHMAMLERHSEVNALLERFFDDTLGRPRRRPAERKQ
jgi:pimeloyl-ACP methyl ester carboxylesterase